jgi:hypothetical protein
MSQTKVLILTPTPGHVVTVYMKTVVATMLDLFKHGIAAGYDTYDASDLPMQRNILATRFLESDFTHLFWIDSDMMFAEDVCRTMLSKNKPIVGTVASGKSFDFSKMEAALGRGLSFEEAKSFGWHWLHQRAPDKDLIVEDGLMQTEYIGCGAVLMSRHVFEIMISRGGVQRQINHQPGNPYYNFFTVRAEPASHGQHVPEDLSFCDRWRLDCGGRIYVLTTAQIFHIGDFAYGGSYFDHLVALKKLQDAEATGTTRAGQHRSAHELGDAMAGGDQPSE